MKNFIILACFLSLGSCIKDIELPFEKSDQTLVVNCLFSEDKNWQVTLSRVKSYDDQTDSIVDDAKVVIVPENKDTIRLNYKSDGIYYADERPVKGIQYQIIINDHSKMITAKSAIPSPVNVSSVNFTDQQTIYFSNPNLSDYYVVPLSLNISSTAAQNFVRLRFHSFNSVGGYNRYVVTGQTITTLRDKGISEAFLNKLSTIIGDSMTIYTVDKTIEKMTDEYNLTYNEFANIVIPAIEVVKVNYRGEESFQIGTIFPNCGWLSNVSRDTYNLLGEFSQTKETSVFVDYIPVMNKNGNKDFTEEYWLEITSMNEDYYKYQKTYINQVLNLSNPFASTIEVYTNIENGVGIFAGYNRQMVHFYNY